MKSVWVILGVAVLGVLTAQAVQISGNAGFSDGADPVNIRVIFAAVSPSAQTDTAYTNAEGDFSRSLQPGVYDVEYWHIGYALYRLPDQVLLFDIVLESVVLMPPLSGYLSGTLGPGDFQVTDSIVVAANASLTILPGTRLWFDGMHEFIIRGLLTALGTQEDSISFTRRYSASNDTVWGGIHFLNASDACRLDFCSIEYGAGLSDDIFTAGGGGIDCQDCDLTLNFCTLRRNESREGAYGGALRFRDCNAQVLGCDLTDNRAQQWGGGIFCRGSAITIGNCRLSRNWASGGSGIMLFDTSQANIVDCHFIDNARYYSAGPDILIAYGSNASIAGCLFEHISVAYGSIVVVGNNSEISRCTFFGQGYTYDSVIDITGAVIVNSCIIFATSGSGFHFDAATQSQIRYCIVYVPNNEVFQNSASGPPAIGLIALTNANGDSCDTYYNIFADPQFVDTANGDYHLLATSPCIDAGDPTLPYDPDGTVADIGAFYFDQLGADDSFIVPRSSFLVSAYPNPFNAQATITFSLPTTGAMQLKVYDVTGREVRTLREGTMNAGEHTVRFDAADLPSGIYFARLEMARQTMTQKLLLVR